jgi:hypothetical protein
MSKRFIIALLVIAALSLVASQKFFRRSTDAVIANSQIRSFPAYTANFEEYVAKTGDPVSLSRRVLRAQRTDGTVVEVEDTLSKDGKSQYTTRNIYRFDGTLVYVRDAQRIGVAIANRFTNSQTDLTRFDPARQCKVNYAGTADYQAAPELEPVTSLGLMATRLDSDSPTVHHRVWRVPAVGCLQARRLTEFKGKDRATTDTSDYTLVKLQVAEPPASLFEVPPDYESVTPTQFYERLLAMFGATLDEGTRKSLAIADQEHAKQGIKLSELK